MSPIQPLRAAWRPGATRLLVACLGIGLCLSSAAGLLYGLAGCEQRRQLERLGEVPAFTFTDQEGRAFGLSDLRGQVAVVAFMFTRCPTICPMITATMQQLQARAKSAGVKIHWVSFSVDPENDTPAVLKAYAEERHIDLSTWTFLTGDSAQIRTIAEQGFKLAAEGKAEPGADHYGISHGSHLVLLDGTGQIRGYYRTLEEDAQHRLLDDAKLLSAQ